MDFHQLRTFSAVADTGSITRAAEKLNLSQPAVSAQIKALEEILALTLFERTTRGMELTTEGRAILNASQKALQAHAAVIREAVQMRGTVAGPFRLAGAANAPGDAVGALMIALAEHYPQVDVNLVHATSPEVLTGVRAGDLDAGFCVTSEDLEADLVTIETARFGTYLAAPAGLVPKGQALDWHSLVRQVWIVPNSGTCCGLAIEKLFCAHNLRPKQTIQIDRESVTRTLIAGGVGIGLLHADTARAAVDAGEVDILMEVEKAVRVLFVHAADRSADPVLRAVTSILRKG